ncbi:MAG: hypothetical protein ACLQUY_26790 [Ktedonobacterales bacterium]
MRFTPIAQRGLLLLSLAAMLCLAACGTSTASTSASATSTPAPTATATAVKNQATSVPVASAAECGQLLSLSEANQYTNPPSPATTIFPLEDSGTALCYYETALHQTTVGLVFKAYTGGTISEGIQQALSSSTSDVKLTSSQPVSGIGDQALFATVTGSSTSNGVTVPLTENILFVVDGAVSFGIINVIYAGVDPLGSASPATVLSDFEQIARAVDSSL